MRITVLAALASALALASFSTHAEEAPVDDAGVAENTGSAENAPPPNNFAGFETWNLANGMRVWFKRIPGSPTVRIQVALPVGAAQDPEGYEGLAHLVEHMMFYSEWSDDPHWLARKHGGEANGATTGYATHYYIDLPSSEWAFGVYWMRDLIFKEPFSFKDSRVSRERDIITAEGNLKPGSDSSGWLFFPESLEYPDWHEREFGFIPKLDSGVGTYESLRRIEFRDAARFFSRYYVPENMLLTVIGDVPEATVKRLVNEQFGDEPAVARDEPRAEKAVDPCRYRRESGYKEGTALVQVRLHYKLYDTTAEDVLMLPFLSKILEEELTDRLRDTFGAAYSAGASVQLFAGHGTISIGSDVLPGKFDEAHRMIDGAIATLSSGNLGTDSFQSLKSRAIHSLRLGDQSPQSLSDWALRYLDRRQFSDFPDVIGYWKKIDQKAVADYCQRRLVRERLVETIIRPASDATPIAIALSLAFILLALGVKRLVVKPAQMALLQYAAHFRFSIAYLAFAGAAALFVYGFLEEATEVAFIQLRLAGLDSWDCEVGRKAIELSVFYGPYLLVLLAALMFVPRKLLLFEHEWRVKFWLWRSKVYRYEDIKEIREERFWKLLFSRRILTSLVLYWGLWRKGVYLRTGKRFAWFFRVRDNAELIHMLELGKRGWTSAEQPTVSSTAQKPEPMTTTH